MATAGETAHVDDPRHAKLPGSWPRMPSVGDTKSFRERENDIIEVGVSEPVLPGPTASPWQP